MNNRSLTAASAVIALVVSGFVPAPASVSLFVGAAEAGSPSQGSSKGQRGKPPPLPPRAKGKTAASPAKQAAKSQKKGKRRAEGKTSKPKTERVAGKQPGPSRRKAKRGKGKTANLTVMPGLAIPRNLAAAAPTTAPPVPPGAAKSPRRTGKAKASPRMQARSKARKEGRVASATSSVMTRTIRPLGGGAPITPDRPPQAKQGKKCRFYFNPFRSWFGGSKKK